ncbi:hypothetical protein R1flu_024337 [Riccia fluitans]|uniref:Uncharacterized protein n=1 Tax=Riccia fluitans TaxID=41844 RepID=A0ABD1XUM1_9MARC
MGLPVKSGGGLQLFLESPHGGDEENRIGDFIDKAVDRAAEWAGTHSPLGIGAFSNGGVMGSHDSNMSPGGFHPSIATDESISWETMPKKTTEQPAETPKNMASRIEAPIPPTVGDDNGLPMEVAWAIPFNVKEWQEEFKRYNNTKWAAGKLNIRKFCDNHWLIDHWEA